MISGAVFVSLVQMQTAPHLRLTSVISISYFDTAVFIQEHRGEQCSSLLHVSEQVGRVYPQAVYFPIRTLYLTLKIEQRERYKSGMLWVGWPARRQRAGFAGHSTSRLLCTHSRPTADFLEHGLVFPLASERTLWGQRAKLISAWNFWFSFAVM